MLCQKCNERQATVHLTQIVGDKMTRRDLCEVCGKDFIDAARSHSLGSLAKGSPLEIPYEMMLSSDSRYTKEAYEFVRAGLDRAQKMNWRPSGPHHISGAQLLEALRELALESFGGQAKARLNSWGIHRCEDFGEIVFNMIKAGLLAKQETDTKKDFQGGYDFDTAFPS